MGDQEKATTNQKTKAKKTTAPPHDSNPFTTTLTGIKKVFRYNTSSLGWTILFNLLLSALLVVSLAAIALALIAFVIQNNSPDSTLLAMVLPPEVISFANSIPIVAVNAIWIIGLLLAIFLGGFMQAIQIKLMTASAAKQTIGFGELLKQSAKRVLPLLGLIALIVMAVIAAIVILALLGQVVGQPIIVLAVLVIAVAFYVCVRLAFSAFAIIEEDIGPIPALKRSFELTKGHFAETMGILAAAAVFVLVPSLIFDLLGAAISGPVSSAIAFISMLVGFVISTIASAGYAERFMQLRNIKSGAVAATKTHAMNYLAVVFVVVGYMISSIASNQHSTDYNQNPYYNSDFEQRMKDSKDQDYDHTQPNSAAPGSENPDSTRPSYNLN